MKYRILVLGGLLAVATSSSAASCLRYYEAVTLSGKVVLKTFFGAPDFGESPQTDARETQGLLILTKPICVDTGADPDDPKERGQKRITLVPMAGVNLQRYTGAMVSVKGHLFHAISGHHHTPVLMQMTDISRQ